MNTKVLEDKLLTVIQENNAALLQQVIGQLFLAGRGVAITFFGSFVEKVAGRERLKLMEALIEDGGKDLIPIFIHAIKQEKNVLYGKSLLFLYGYFEHGEALAAIKEIEEIVHGELEKTYAKLCSSLKAKFRELFYMDEFKLGVQNPKRMNHAAAKMQEEPHPLYIPFLNERMSCEDGFQEKTAIKTLAVLGDMSSVEVMLAALPQTFVHHQRTTWMMTFLLAEKTWKVKKVSVFSENLGKMADWDEETCRFVDEKIKEGRVQQVLDLIKKDILIADTTERREIIEFLKMTLGGVSPQSSHLKKIERSFSVYLASLETRLQITFMALGRLGDRLEVEDLFNRLKGIIPAGHELEEQLMVTFMGGYHSEENLKNLLDALDSSEDLTVLGKLLTSLAEYKLEQLPESLSRLALSGKTQHLRPLVLRIIAESNLLDEILDPLLNHSNLSVRTETFKVIAEYKHTGGYRKLLKIMDDDLSPRILEVLLEALESFPAAMTANVVGSFFVPPHPYSVRAAAMKTLYYAGGPNRMSSILEGIKAYPEKGQPEIIATFLQLHQREKQEIDFLGHPEFWGILLNLDKNAKLRLAVIATLEGADWEQNYALNWPATLQEALNSDKVKRDNLEQRALRVLLQKATASLGAERAVQPEQGETDKRKQGLSDLLDKVESPRLAEKIKGYRLLNLHLKSEWVVEDDPQTERLVEAVLKLFDEHSGSEDLIKMAIGLTGKIRDSRLLGRIKLCLRGGSPALVQFATRVLSGKVAQHHGKPIHSILVLDDTMLITKTLTLSLKKAGFDTSGLMVPNQAMAKLNEHKYDLLILDYMMPGQDGLSFLREARERDIAPKHVLWITSSRDESDMALLRTEPTDGILHKPFAINQLMDLIGHMQVA